MKTKLYLKQRRLSVWIMVAFMLIFFVGLPIANTTPAPWKPQKAVHLIVPVAPGGIYDSQARVLASEMSKILGQPVVVENVPGAGHALGTTQAFRAKPDGHTILFANSATTIVNQILFGAKYDFQKFEYLGQLRDSTKGVSEVFICGTKSGLTSWNDVLKLTRPVRIGAVGKGSMFHVMGMATAIAFGLKDPVFVTGYTGAPEISGGAVRGEFDIAAYQMSNAIPYIKSGDLRAILVISKKEKIEGYPDIPTVGELGHPEIVDQTGSQHILMAPPNTPPEILKVLSEAVYEAASGNTMKEFQIKAVDAGVCWVPLRGEEVRRKMEEVYKGIRPVLIRMEEKK